MMTICAACAPDTQRARFVAPAAPPLPADVEAPCSRPEPQRSFRVYIDRLQGSLTECDGKREIAVESYNAVKNGSKPAATKP